MHTSEFLWSTAAIIKETKDAVTVVFETSGIPLEQKAGQYISVTLIIDGLSFTRSYSLSSCPDGDEKPAITVKRVEGGIVSNYIYEHVEDINEWKVSGPHGRFYIDEEVSKEKQYVLIAGGSGITPIFSMLKLLVKNTNASVLLIYCNRTRKDIIYSKALNYLENAFPERLHVYHVLSRAREGDVLTAKNSIRGKLSKLVLKKIIKSIYAKHEEASFFLCGPTGLIVLAEETIHGMSQNEAKIYKEYFQPEKDEKIGVELPTLPQEVLIHYYEQTNLLEVLLSESILESGLKDKCQ